MEVWKNSKEHDEFEISNEGRVRHKKSKKLVHSSIDERGNEIVFLCCADGRHKRRVSRLVAESFLEEDISKMNVVNINGDKRKNELLNLKAVPKSRRVRVLETGKVYNSISECSKATGVNKSTISKCMNYKFHGNKKGHTFIPEA